MEEPPVQPRFGGHHLRVFLKRAIFARLTRYGRLEPVTRARYPVWMKNPGSGEVYENTEGLAAGIKNGEDDAYRSFAALYGRRLRGFFIARGLRIEEAEDLAISCITDICLKIDKYRATEAGFDAWVFAIARNALADVRRRTPRVEQLSHTVLAVEHPTERNEALLEVFYAAVEELGEADQAILRLRDLGPEASYAEIAGELGIDERAARTRHFRALRRLQSRLELQPAIRQWLSKRGHPVEVAEKHEG